MIITITDDNFEAEVLKASKPVLLDFWAEWCAPCRMIAPILEEIAAEQDDVIIGKVDAETNPALAKRFQIMSIPLLVLMNGEKIIKKSLGALPKDKILEIINTKE